MKKAIITGITGQDGSYLAEMLLYKGYDMLELKGSWQVERLKEFAILPWQDGRVGVYVVAIKQSKYKPVHGHSRFVYIGGMGTMEKEEAHD